MRTNINLGLILVGFLAVGCSSEIDSVSEDSVRDYSNVEISLQSDPKIEVSTTRAAIMGDDEDVTSNINNIGVFGLARTTQEINNTAGAINWFHNTENWSDCILDNVKSYKEGNDIKWANPDDVYFYPVSQFYSYDFYGYYPRVSNPIKTYNRVCAEYTIDGTQDLIWGRATSSEKYAYSARYYRESQENSTKRPNIALKHLLTRLVFKAIPGETYAGSGDYSAASTMLISSVELVDVATGIGVVIADNSKLDMDLSDRIYKTGTVGTLPLTSVDDSGNNIPFVPVHMGDDPATAVQLGESVMLYPENQYTIRISLIKDPYTDAVTGTDYPAQTYITEIPLQIQNDGLSAFEQGTSYNITITVHGPKSISLTSTLTPWIEKEGPSIEL